MNTNNLFLSSSFLLITKGSDDYFKKAEEILKEGEHEIIYKNAGLKAGIYILFINSGVSRQYIRIVVQ